MSDARRRREPVLDGVRGVAILLVLFYHFVLYSGFARAHPVDRYIGVIGEAAWLGVDLFFVLSGFLITGILLDTKSDPRFFRTFYARRTVRIFPLYYGVLAVVFVIGPLVLGREPFGPVQGGEVWYWTYLSNVDIALNGWREPQEIGHFWSLAVEEQFYLLWPVLVYVTTRRRLMWVAAVCFVGAVLLRTGAFALDRRLAAYVLMPMRIDALAAGAFLAALVRGSTGWALLGRWPSRVFAISFASLLAVFYWRRGLSYMDPVVGTIGYSLIAACAASLIAVVVSAPQGARLKAGLSHPALVALGTYSYGLYVFHHIVVIALRDQGFQVDLFPRFMGSQTPGLVGFSVVAMTGSWVLAYVSWHAWEMPFLRLKRFFEYRQPPTVGDRAVPGAVGGVGVSHAPRSPASEDVG